LGPWSWFNPGLYFRNHQFGRDGFGRIGRKAEGYPGFRPGKGNGPLVVKRPPDWKAEPTLKTFRVKG